MKKLFIGLLIVAAGTAIFFLLPKKNKQVIADNFQHQQIIGKWKLDSVWTLKNSDAHLISKLVNTKLATDHYEFNKDGYIFQLAKDSLIKDSARYEWAKEDQLIWNEYPSGTADELFSVSLLNKDSMQLQAKDSSVLLFTKLK